MNHELGEMVLRCLIRSHGENRMMIVGSVATTTALPPGDYSLTLHLESKIMGERWMRTEQLLAVPDGMIPLGMRADDILTSSIDLSPESIARFISARSEQS